MFISLFARMGCISLFARGRFLIGYQKLLIISNNIQAGIFVAGQEGWIKMNENLLNIGLRHAL